MHDRWGDYKYRDKVKDGVVFHVKYLGSMLVSELNEEGQSYGDHISSESIKTIVAMSKSSGKKLPMTSLTVSPLGLRVINMETQDVVTDLDIYRICFCTADRAHEKVFAYIARNRENETMECHAFQCEKRKIAEAITLTVAESFQIAKELVENGQLSAPHSDADTAAAADHRLSASDATSYTLPAVDVIQHTLPDQSSPSQVVPPSLSPPPSRQQCAVQTVDASDDLMLFMPTESVTPRQPPYRL
jgi:low density lipoprotein receptor adapter protein 1